LLVSSIIGVVEVDGPILAAHVALDRLRLVAQLPALAAAAGAPLAGVTARHIFGRLAVGGAHPHVQAVAVLLAGDARLALEQALDAELVLGRAVVDHVPARHPRAAAALLHRAGAAQVAEVAHRIRGLDVEPAVAAIEASCGQRRGARGCERSHGGAREPRQRPHGKWAPT
jgi:hypothetical protein